MFDWLLLPVDPSQAHDIGTFVSWHGRLMMIGWGVLLPLGVFIARFLKIWPNQNWPRQLDNQRWWMSHLTLQWMGTLLVAAGFFLVWKAGYVLSGESTWHRWFGFLALTLLVLQVGSGLLRGTKGGPTDPAPDGSLWGDHYNMSRRRIVFEVCHKSVGYMALLCAAAAIGTGLWGVNAQRWIVALIAIWWLALACFAVAFQRKGRCIDTYQAIWGPEKQHPGNLLRPIGIGVHRYSAEWKEKQ